MKSKVVRNQTSIRASGGLLRTISTCVAGLITAVMPLVVVAQEPPPTHTDEIVQMYCENNGHLATCLGRKPEECDGVIRPLVEKCEAEMPQGSEEEQAVAFSTCFGREFSAIVPKDVQFIPGCYENLEFEDAIKPPPPEFEGTGIYVPPGHPVPAELIPRRDF